jgi:hypothetical protein
MQNFPRVNSFMFVRYSAVLQGGVYAVEPYSSAVKPEEMALMNRRPVFLAKQTPPVAGNSVQFCLRRPFRQRSCHTITTGLMPAGTEKVKRIARMFSTAISIR